MGDKNRELLRLWVTRSYSGNYDFLANLKKWRPQWGGLIHMVECVGCAECKKEEKK